MLQGFYVMKVAEVSESRQRSQVYERAAEQAAVVLVGVRLTTYTAPSRSLCRTKKGVQQPEQIQRRIQEAAPDPSFGLSQKSLKKRSLFSAKSTARLFGMLPESYRRFCGIFR